MQPVAPPHERRHTPCSLYTAVRCPVDVSHRVVFVFFPLPLPLGMPVKFFWCILCAFCINHCRHPSTDVAFKTPAPLFFHITLCGGRRFCADCRCNATSRVLRLAACVSTSAISTEVSFHIRSCPTQQCQNNHLVAAKSFCARPSLFALKSPSNAKTYPVRSCKLQAICKKQRNNRPVNRMSHQLWKTAKVLKLILG